MTDIRKCYYIYISIMYTHNKTLLLLLKREINLNTLEEKRNRKPRASSVTFEQTETGYK